MICPYCDKEMKQGYVHSYKYDLRWYPNDPEGKGIFAACKESKKLSSVWSHGEFTMHRCENCKKLIVDENELDV